MNNSTIAPDPDGVLYGISRTNNFVRIDTTNETGTLIGLMGFTNMSALAATLKNIKENQYENKHC